MAEMQTPDGKKVYLYPPPSKDFNPFTATDMDLLRHGLPLRPDPRKQPELAALWDRRAARYRTFDHLEPKLDYTTSSKKALTPALGLDPTESCGYQLTTDTSAPFTSLAVTWTIPDLYFTASQNGIDYFHTFVGLGFLDLHVEMTVDSADNVTSAFWSPDIGQISVPVRPGDVVSASLCLQTNQAGTGSYNIANETTAQTMSFSINTGYPPAVTVNAGVTRSSPVGLPFAPLARFGVVYFDEITADTTSGLRSLTSGDATTMVDQNNTTLATPVMLTASAFKAVFGSA
jgi:Peptidase A4 family